MRSENDISLNYLKSSTSDEPPKRINEKMQSSAWYMEQYSIQPNGSLKLYEPWFTGNNNETGYLMHLLLNNPIVLGLIITKCDILRGKRLTLFNTDEKDKDGNPAILEMKEFPEQIREFYEYNQLNLWAYDSFMHHEMLGNYFSEVIFSQGSSQSGKIATDLTQITPECVRAQRANNVRKRVDQYGISEHWPIGLKYEDIEKIPAFHHKDFYSPDREFDTNRAGKNILFHGKRNLPHMPVYAVPRWYGARHWLETQNLVPIFHKNNLSNMFGLRVQMSISRSKVEQLMQQGDGKGNPYSEKQVLDLFSSSATKYLTNPENAGKAIATAHDYDHQGKMLKDIEFGKIAVEMNDGAYTALDPIMNQSVTSSLGTSPSLAGIIMNQNLPSGSEQKFAWNIEVTKGAYLRDLILKPLRFIHKFNKWPDNLVWGFEDAVMVTADENKQGVVPKESPQKEKEDAVQESGSK